MDTELQKRIETIEKKLDAIYVSAEKTRKYFLWTIIATIVTLVLPLIGLMFVLPQYIAQLEQVAKF